MRATLAAGLLVVFLVSIQGSGVEAQQTAGAGTEQPAAPGADQPTEPETFEEVETGGTTVSETPAPAEAEHCFPPCRSGHVCSSGQCVSICNPPCAPGERCTQYGECVPESPAVDDVPEEPAHLHTGFFLRLSIGFGYSRASWDTGPDDIALDGGTGMFAFDIGGAVTENLIIHARMSDFLNFSPTVEVGGQEFEADEVTLGFVLYGAGLTYYLMPVNVYATVAFGASLGVLDIDGEEYGETDVGFGVEGDLGKEWWVGSEWGLGVAARFSYAAVPPSGSSSDSDWLHGMAFGLLFSATYN